MPERWIEIRTLVGAAAGCVVAVLHVEHTTWPCGHLHRSEDTAGRCAAERWPDVEVGAQS